MGTSNGIELAHAQGAKRSADLLVGSQAGGSQAGEGEREGRNVGNDEGGAPTPAESGSRAGRVGGNVVAVGGQLRVLARSLHGMNEHTGLAVACDPC